MRDLVAFPGIPMTIDMDKGPAKRIFENAIKENYPVFIICQKDPMKEVGDITDVYSVGVTAKIKQTVKTQSGVFRVIVEPLARAVITAFTDDKFTHAEIYERSSEDGESELRCRALLREIKGVIRDFMKYAPSFSKEFWLLFDTIRLELVL